MRVGSRGIDLSTGRMDQLGRGIKPGRTHTLFSSPKILVRGLNGRTSLRHVDGSRRSYRGSISFVRMPSGLLRITNIVPTRDYVTSVVGSETNPDFPAEELKAQAVLAQTMLARYKPGDQLGDTTEKEAYLGAEYERPEAKQAVNSVWQEVLTYGGKPIQTYFHSTCAGGTSNGAAYFKLKPAEGFPYLCGQSCSFCRKSPFWQEKTSSIPISLYAAKFFHSDPMVCQVDGRQRPIKVLPSKANASEAVVGFTFWTEVGQKLGWDKVPGTRFKVELDPARKHLIFRSTGAGHGVGLCQWGASELARTGKNYRQILDFYFPGTVVQKNK